MPIYVAVRIAPGTRRDPVRALVDALTPMGFVGVALDGATIGAPGWVVATTLGLGEGTGFRRAPADRRSGRHHRGHDDLSRYHVDLP